MPRRQPTAERRPRPGYTTLPRSSYMSRPGQHHLSTRPALWHTGCVLCHSGHTGVLPVGVLGRPTFHYVPSNQVTPDVTWEPQWQSRLWAQSPDSFLCVCVCVCVCTHHITSHTSTCSWGPSEHRRAVPFTWALVQAGSGEGETLHAALAFNWVPQKWATSNQAVVVFCFFLFL